MTAILGISAFYHDSAAALVIDGQLIAAAQEERFTRKKHDHDFPQNAIDYCKKRIVARENQSCAGLGRLGVNERRVAENGIGCGHAPTRILQKPIPLLRLLGNRADNFCEVV